MNVSNTYSRNVCKSACMHVGRMYASASDCLCEMYAHMYAGMYAGVDECTHQSMYKGIGIYQRSNVSMHACAPPCR